MKHRYIAIFLGSISCISPGMSFSQDQFSTDFAPIRSELQAWDSVRGEWLSNSMIAIAKNEPIPDRTFPENFTPSEMMSVVPSGRRENIRAIANTNSTAQRDRIHGNSWSRMSDFMDRPSCQPVTGRSYGDPHLSTFDGKAFSFQTVGEFVLAKSGSGNMEVQTRQKASGTDFSLNTAVAMNVAGDRVCIYADEKPDSDNSTPLRVEGRSVMLENSTYFLPHGGTIRQEGKEYVVTWPTGEKVSAQLSKTSGMGFMNVTTQIFPCTRGGYQGLLGNANGIADDDINTGRGYNYTESANRFNTVFGSSQSSSYNAQLEKEYLNYLAKDFGAYWRVDRMHSLFDYGMGQSPEYFTDLSFPRIHRTVNDLSQAQRDNARRNCEAQGIRGNDLNGCIFDQAYINLPPNPRPVFRDPTQGVVLTTVSREGVKRNVNPPATDPTKTRSGNVTTPTESTPKPVIRPVKEGSTLGNTGTQQHTESGSGNTKVPAEGTRTQPQPAATKQPEIKTPATNGSPTTTRPVTAPKQTTTAPVPATTKKPAPTRTAPANSGSKSSPVIAPGRL